MLYGVLEINGCNFNAVYPETIEERKKGLDGQKIDGVMIFLYCCPSYVVFRGCKDRPIDIAFGKRQGNCFRIFKIVSSLYTDDMISVDNVEMVIEAEEGFFNKNQIQVGTICELKINVNGVLRNIAELYTQREELEQFSKFIDKKFEQAGISPEEGRKFLERTLVPIMNKL